MNIAVFSDVHANLTAFEAVLRDMDAKNIEHMVCLGDTIGYGPDPEECARLVMARKIPSVLGNHEWALKKKTHKRWFNVTARPTLDITESLISDEVKNFCRALPDKIENHGALFVHGAPPDSVVRYLFQYDDKVLARAMARMGPKICFAGHTHELKLYELGQKGLEHRELPLETTTLSAANRYIVNVGSVGQPRDDYGYRAKYVIWNPDRHTIQAVAVDYDVNPVKSRMRKAGFPENFVNRLDNR